MKKLILVRHAKSSWDTISDDHTRPISQRGMNDAHLVSNELIAILPDKFIIWSSSAKRAQETATIFCQNLDISLDCVQYKEELYTFECSKLAKQIKSCNNIHDTLIIFGHNEAITKFVTKFGDKPFKNVPTSGVVVIQFDVDSWKDIVQGRTEVNIFPRDLKKHEHKYTE